MHRGKNWGFAGLGLGMVALLGVSLAAAQTAPAAPPPAPNAAVAPSPPVVATSSEAAEPPVQQLPAAVPANQVQPPARPLITLQKDAPLPAPVMRTDRTHDGFYARLSLGFGHLGATMNPRETNGIKGSGSTLAVDFALGYAVSPGIILGGTLMMESLPSARLDADAPIVTDVRAGLLGPFFDGYPKARGGFHLGGGLGVAGTRLNPQSAAGFNKATGYGIAGWLGYDIWVAEQWSAGILLRLMGTRTKADAIETNNGLAGNATMATQSIAIMLTGVYN